MSCSLGETGSRVKRIREGAPVPQIPWNDIIRGGAIFFNELGEKRERKKKKRSCGLMRLRGALETAELNLPREFLAKTKIYPVYSTVLGYSAAFRFQRTLVPRLFYDAARRNAP